ncbi:hypothetical protein ACJWDR_29110 [Streptomyces tauricus]
MTTSQALVIVTVAVFTALALAYQLIRALQDAEETVADALRELDEEGQS